MRKERKLKQGATIDVSQLWKSTPKDMRVTWLTPLELRDRLVAGGVDSSLDVSQVSSMLNALMKRGLVSDHRLKTAKRLR